jgi:hypothetical protein
MNSYYPLKRVRDRIGDELVEQMIVTPGESKSWSYLFADWDGEWLLVETNAHHTITSVSFTPKFRSVWISLKIHKKKWFRICRYNGHASWVENMENVN